MRIVVGDFNAKVGKENTFKLTTGNGTLLESSNYNGVRIVNVATFTNLSQK
jgi:hypothetical protein